MYNGINLDMSKRIRSLATGLAGKDLTIIDNPNLPPFYSPDSSTMNIPVSTLPKSRLDRVPAWIAHEVGHSRFTPKEMCSASDSDLYRHLVNAIEDARIEEKMIARFPGVKGELESCAVDMFSKAGQGSNLATNVYNHVLVRARHLLYKRDELRSASDEFKSMIPEEVRDKLDSFFPEEVPSTFKEVEELARRVEDLIRYHNGGDLGGDQDQDQNQDQDQAGKSKGNGNDKSNQTKQGQGDEGDAKITSNSNSNNKIPRNANDTVIDSSSKVNASMMDNRQDATANQKDKEESSLTMSDRSKEWSRTMTRIQRTSQGREQAEYIYNNFIYNNVGSKISSRLQVRARTVVSKRPTGLLDTKRITHLFTDNLGVFKSRSIYKSNDRDVILLIDASGSMQGVQPQLSGIVYSTLKGLRQVRGTKSSCYVYNGYGVKCLINQTDTITMEKCLFNADSNTPTATAINSVLLGNYNPNRVCDLILVTDGAPDDQSGFVKVCQSWSSVVRLSCISVGLAEIVVDQYIKKGIPNTKNFTDANDLSKLGDYLAELLTYNF